MFVSQPSILSLSAAALYAAVVAACLAALMTAITRRQVRWHVFGWSAIAVLFAVLAIMRVFALEDLLREELRSGLRNGDGYDDRRALQGPIFAALFVVAALVSAVWAFRVSRSVKGRRNIAAMIAIGSAGTLTFFVFLRIISLHSADELLYGPLKLNWVIDIGSSIAVLACGGYYWRVVTRRP